jgi:hypothetical protein
MEDASLKAAVVDIVQMAVIVNGTAANERV